MPESESHKEEAKMRKRILVALCALAVVSLLFVGCGGTQAKVIKIATQSPLPAACPR